MNTYNKIIKYLNKNNLSFKENLNTYSKILSIDGFACNNLFFVNLCYKLNSKTVITDYTFDIENMDGELCTIEYRISYKELIQRLGEL